MKKGKRSSKIKNLRSSAQGRRAAGAGLTAAGSGAGDLRETLIETTLQLLQKKSPADLSLREVARLSGVSEAAPYRHFKDKEALLAAISARGFDLLRGMLARSQEASPDYREQFIEAGQAYLRMGLKYPQHLRLMFGPWVTPSEQHQELFVAGKSAFLTLVKIIQDGQRAGVIGPGQPFHRAMHCWMMVHGFTMLVIDFRCAWLGVAPESAAPAMRLFSEDILNGMARPLDTETGAFRLVIPELPLELLRQVGIEARIVID